MNFINIKTNTQLKEIWNSENYSIFLFYEENCSTCSKIISEISKYKDFTVHLIEHYEHEELFDEYQVESVPWITIVKKGKIIYEMSVKYMNLTSFFKKYSLYL